MNYWQMISEFYKGLNAVSRFLLLTNIVLFYAVGHLWVYSNKKFDYLEKEIIECHKGRAVFSEGALNANTRALEKLIYTIETNNKTTR
jgi:hypothetical protein